MRVPGYRTKLRSVHLERARLPRRFWNVGFDGVPESARGHLSNYLRNIDDMLDNGSGLLLWGNNGVGKTSVATLILMEACRRGATALFATAESLRQSSIDGTLFDEDQSLADRAREVELLVIDDLGKEHRGATEYAEGFLENLLRERSASMLSTIVTTNLPVREGEKGPDGRGLPGLPTIYPHSMLEVLRETLYPVSVEGENKRLRGADQLEERLAV